MTGSQLNLIACMRTQRSALSIVRISNYKYFLIREKEAAQMFLPKIETKGWLLDGTVTGAPLNCKVVMIHSRCHNQNNNNNNELL